MKTLENAIPDIFCITPLNTPKLTNVEIKRLIDNYRMTELKIPNTWVTPLDDSAVFRLTAYGFRRKPVSNKAYLLKYL